MEIMGQSRGSGKSIIQEGIKISNNKFLFPFFVLLICLLAFLLYFRNLNAPFVFDDQAFISQSSKLRDITDFKSIANSILLAPSRSVAFFTFAVNYHFHQLNVFGYHLVNLFIHIVNVFLVWWFGFMLLSEVEKKKRGEAFLLSFFASLIFLSHPVQTQAVSYITQRFASLSSLFYLLSTCFYLKARLSNKRSMFYYVGFVFAGVLGIFTKEIVVTLPIIIVFIEFYFLRQKELGIRKKFDWKDYLPLLSVFFIVPLFRYFNLSSLLFEARSSASHQGDLLTFSTYIWTQGRVFVVFMRLLFLPLWQNADYDFPMSKSFFELPVIFSFLLIVVVLFFAFKFRKRYPLVSFGVFWFFIVLLANLVPRRHVIFEHKLYLASVGFCIAISELLFQILKSKRNYCFAMCFIVVILSVLTLNRNKVWMSKVALWEDVVKKSPEKLRAHTNLGSAYLEIGDLDKALKHFNKANEISPDNSKVFNYKGLMYSASGNYVEAIKQFDIALKYDPDYAEVYCNMGIIFMRQGKYDIALKHVKRSLELNPYYAQSYNTLGVIYFYQKRYNESVSQYNIAIEINPEYVNAYLNRGDVFKEINEFDRSLKNFNKAIGLAPEQYSIFENRAALFFKMKEFELAIDDLTYVIEKGPARAVAFTNRAKVYALMGRYNDAILDNTSAIKINSKDAVAYYNRSLLNKKIGKFKSAYEDAIKALDLGVNVRSKYLSEVKSLF